MNSECCESCVFLPKRHLLKQTSTEDGLNGYEREIAPTEGVHAHGTIYDHFMLYLYCNDINIFSCTWLPNQQFSRCHWKLYNFNVVSPSLGVTTVEVGSHGRSSSGQRDP